jgi:hypothetical protein
MFKPEALRWAVSLAVEPCMLNLIFESDFQILDIKHDARLCQSCELFGFIEKQIWLLILL